MSRLLAASVAVLLSAGVAIAQGATSTQEKIGEPVEPGSAGSAGQTVQPADPSLQEKIEAPTATGQSSAGGNDPNPTDPVVPPRSPADKQAQ